MSSLQSTAIKDLVLWLIRNVIINRVEWHQKSLEILEQSLEGDYSNIANSYNTIGEVHRTNGDLEQAKKSFQTAWMSLKKEFDEENHPRMA